jgi:beta-lactamase superfamily II metal-dependent hydrolase
MFEIEMLPADHGDCLILSYGDEKAPRRVLIDGGTTATFPRLVKRLEQLFPEGRPHFELLIVTHIDADHIGGIIKLLRSKLPVTFDDIWFNGWPHLVPPTSRYLGPRQGDTLGNILSMRADLPWNKAFGGATVVVPEDGPLPVRLLEGGLKVTLLSPTWKELAALDTSWTDTVFRQGRIPGEVPPTLAVERAQLEQLAARPFLPDHAVANGSSIAILAEYKGKSCLLTGDAFAPTLLASIQRLVGKKKLDVDALKLPHHASKANVSGELLGVIKTPRYLISTDGSIFGHPDEEAIARVLQEGGDKLELFFNYRTPMTLRWKDIQAKRSVRAKRGSTASKPQKPQAHYPSEKEEGGLLIRL